MHQDKRCKGVRVHSVECATYLIRVKLYLAICNLWITLKHQDVSGEDASMYKWTILYLLVLLPSSVMAEIYRWVDAQGRVQFGERPAPNAELVDIRPQVIERDERTIERQRNIQRIMDVRAEEREIETARSLARREKAKAQCDQVRRQLAQFEGRRYWYEEDANGKKIEVHPSRVNARKLELESLLKERC